MVSQNIGQALMAIESIWQWQEDAKLSTHPDRSAWWEEMVKPFSDMPKGRMLSLG